MNIGIIGVGGVGGFFGGKIARFLESRGSGEHVSFLARGAHLSAIQERGLILLTEEDGEIECHPDLATDRVSDLPPLDVCLMCVKSYDLGPVAEKLQEKVGDGTVILPLLNGIDIYERLRVAIAGGVILPACVYVGTQIEKPGRVVQKGGACKIICGPDPLRPGHDVSHLLGLLDSAGIRREWSADPYPEVWGKFVFIAAFGLVAACHDATLGQVLESGQMLDETRSVMKEIFDLALISGVRISPTIVNDSLKKAAAFPFEAKTSFQRDFEDQEKKDERDLFGGTIIRLGEEFGVKTDATRRLYDVINGKKPRER
jgi:2-dehydropantoate 2-reductase